MSKACYYQYAYVLITSEVHDYTQILETDTSLNSSTASVYYSKISVR